MARLPDAFIDDLLARTDIVEVIGSRVPLKRQGKEYSARCPFHDERSPSFTVSPTKQFYHCFGCQAHGTAISFLMNYDRLEFLDAVDELAKRVGMEVPRDAQPRQDGEDGRDLYNVLDATAKFFQKQLASSEKARTYLDKRDVDAGTRERFMIGYAPDGYAGLKDALGSDERRLKLLDRAGLLSKSDNGRVYDKFRDRVMFPIHDRRGRTIAFGGRVLDPEDSPKYLNSPETALFHKGRELYGLWQVRQAHSKIERLIVVEGYMDVVALFQHGVTQAVATLGTATTPDHVELLFRNSADVYFCFDGDRAGRSAAWKAVESCVSKMRDGRQAFFQFLPEGEDPDTIVRKVGAVGFDAMLQESLPLSQFLFREIERDVNVQTSEGKSRVWEICKPLIAIMPDGSFKDRMIEDLHRRAGNPNKLERAHLGTGQDLRSTKLNAYEVTDKYARSRSAPLKPKRSLIRSVISLLLQQPSLALEIDPPYRFNVLRQPGIELLTELIALIKARPDVTTGVLLEYFDGRGEAEALNKLAAVSFSGDEIALTKDFLSTIYKLDLQAVDQEQGELAAKMRSAGVSSLDESEREKLATLLKDARELRALIDKHASPG